MLDGEALRDTEESASAVIRKKHMTGSDYHSRRHRRKMRNPVYAFWYWVARWRIHKGR